MPEVLEDPVEESVKYFPNQTQPSPRKRSKVAEVKCTQANKENEYTAQSLKRLDIRNFQKDPNATKPQMHTVPTSFSLNDTSQNNPTPRDEIFAQNENVWMNPPKTKYFSLDTPRNPLEENLQTTYFIGTPRKDMESPRPNPRGNSGKPIGT